MGRSLNDNTKTALASSAASYPNSAVRILSVEQSLSNERYNFGLNLHDSFENAGWKTDPIDNSAIFVTDRGIIFRVKDQNTSTSNGTSDIMAAFNSQGLSTDIEYDPSMPDWYIFVIIGTN